MENLPTTTKGLTVSKDNKVSIAESTLPTMGADDVLIKIHSAPINPSDDLYLQGVYPGGKNKPIIAGFEGSGLVIATGEGEKAKALMGRRVAVFPGEKDQPGTYGSYTVVSNSSAFPLPETVDYEQGACSLVNPLTVEAFIHEAEKNGTKAVVHSAAASSLGKLFVGTAKTSNIKLINIVRRKEQVDILKALGAEYIVNTAEENWKESLTALINEHKPRVFFDAVGGKTANDIIQLLPTRSTTFSYGALSGKAIEMAPFDLILNDKVLRGLWLTNYLKVPELAGKLFKGAFTKLATGIYKTVIAKRFTQDKGLEAVDFVRNNKATKGKVLIQNGNF